MKKKIVLGTAQFIKNYSLFKKKLSKKEKIKILSAYKKRGFETFEVSPIYGDAEKIIGKNCKNKNLIWKLPKIPKKKENLDLWINIIFKDSLRKLGEKKIDILMIHESKDLLGKYGEEIYKIIKNLKDKGFVKHLGVSVYKKNILNKIIKKFKIDVVQLPFNILNYEFEEKDLFFLKKKNKNLKIHARSIFHQGLLLKKIKSRNKKFKNLAMEQNRIMNKLEAYCIKYKCNLFQLCVSYVLNNKYIDKILIGVESVKELNEILNLKKGLSVSFLKMRYNKKLLDPISWLKLKH